MPLLRPVYQRFCISLDILHTSCPFHAWIPQLWWSLHCGQCEHASGACHGPRLHRLSEAVLLLCRSKKGGKGGGDDEEEEADDDEE